MFIIVINKWNNKRITVTNQGDVKTTMIENKEGTTRIIRLVTDEEKNLSNDTKWKGNEQTHLKKVKRKFRVDLERVRQLSLIHI